jgi:hypothetical protein
VILLVSLVRLTYPTIEMVGTVVKEAVPFP